MTTSPRDGKRDRAHMSQGPRWHKMSRAIKTVGSDLRHFSWCGSGCCWSDKAEKSATRDKFPCRQCYATCLSIIRIDYPHQKQVRFQSTMFTLLCSFCEGNKKLITIDYYKENFTSHNECWSADYHFKASLLIVACRAKAFCFMVCYYYGVEAVCYKNQTCNSDW